MATRRRDPRHDCLIVGGGPAGLVAATYLARYRRDVLLVDAGDSRAAKIPRSRNVPGFPDGIPGTRLLQRLRAQAERAGGVVTPGCIEAIERDGGGFVARHGRRVVRARTVLVATGMADHAPVPGLTRAGTLRGVVRWCPVCDGRESLDREVVVIGEALHGVPHALFLRTWTRRLTLVLAPAERLPARARAELAAAGIALVVAEVRRATLGEQGGCLELADGRRLPFDVVYPMTGGSARSKLALALGERGDRCRALRTGPGQRCATPGLYAAGDVVAGLHQISVAVGHGAIAATAIHNALPRNFR